MNKYPHACISYYHLLQGDIVLLLCCNSFLGKEMLSCCHLTQLFMKNNVLWEYHTVRPVLG